MERTEAKYERVGRRHALAGFAHRATGLAALPFSALARPGNVRNSVSGPPWPDLVGFR